MTSALLDTAHLLTLTLIFAPVTAAVMLGLVWWWRAKAPSESFTIACVSSALWLSFAASIAATILLWSALRSDDQVILDDGDWLRVGDYHIPAVFLVDRVSVAFSLMTGALSVLIARFSQTYLHRDPGFVRFYVLLGLFATGAQLTANAGALDVMFAGWELVGVSSALFIGFFHTRAEPARSSLFAFATYRLCDIGFLLGMVVVHESIGSTRLSALADAHLDNTGLALLACGLFLLAAAGKSAQLPFSGWLARAMEGPTPSSALFYGGVSVHLGVLLILRTWPLFEQVWPVRVLGIIMGLATAMYSTWIARTLTDAKGTLAHATLAQVGLILAEICAGFTTLALIHLVTHACLRVFQYLRAPNAIHDAHRLGHHPHAKSLPARWYVLGLFRWRLDDKSLLVVRAVEFIARPLDWLDRRLRGAAS